MKPLSTCSLYINLNFSFAITSNIKECYSHSKWIMMIVIFLYPEHEIENIFFLVADGRKIWRNKFRLYHHKFLDFQTKRINS